jgi:hypothetical protein
VEVKREREMEEIKMWEVARGGREGGREGC